MVAIGLMLCVTSNAGAVEIPATAECKATFQELAQSDDGESGLLTYEGSLKQLVNGLVDAGCLSDAAPMVVSISGRSCGRGPTWRRTNVSIGGARREKETGG